MDSGEFWHTMDDPPSHKRMCILLDIEETKKWEMGGIFTLGWYDPEAEKWITLTGLYGNWTHWTNLPSMKGL